MKVRKGLVVCLHNEKIRKTIANYCNLPVAPEYSILVKGHWGTGKTYFIDSFIKEKTDDFKFLNVSLYGMASIDEIEERFFQLLNPILSSKKMVLARQLGKGFLKGAFKIDLDGDGKGDGSLNASLPNINLQDYLTDTQNCILVFDDVERCSMELGQLLGYINHFVEREGYKVILIADEEKLLERETEQSQPYTKIKEKLIGKSLTISSDVSVVYDSFISEIALESTRSVFSDNKKLVIDVYKQSGYQNLRSLRKIFIDFNSFYCELDEKIKESESLVSELLRIFCVLSFEVYAGSLTSDLIPDFIGFGGFLWLSDEKYKAKSERNRALASKYNLDHIDSIIDVSSWTEWFSDGNTNFSNVNEVLLKSAFILKETTPNWKKLLQLFDLDEQEYTSLIKDVWSEFKNGEITELGPIKHIVGIYLYLAEHRLISRKASGIVNEARRVIKKLALEKKLVVSSDFDPIDDMGVYDGYTYWGNSIDEFANFCRDFEQIINEYQIQKRLDCSPSLLKLVTSDLEQLQSLLTDTDEKDNYAYVSVMNGINVTDFVMAVESLQSESKRKLFKILSNRYKNQSSSHLKDELLWAKAVVERLQKRHRRKTRKIESFSLLRFVEWLEKEIDDSLSRL